MVEKAFIPPSESWVRFSPSPHSSLETLYLHLWNGTAPCPAAFQGLYEDYITWMQIRFCSLAMQGVSYFCFYHSLASLPSYTRSSQVTSLLDYFTCQLLCPDTISNQWRHGFYPMASGGQSPLASQPSLPLTKTCLLTLLSVTPWPHLSLPSLKTGCCFVIWSEYLSTCSEEDKMEF